MRLLQSKVNTKTILRPAGPLWVLKRCGTLVSQLMPSQFGVLFKSSWLEISRSGAPDREDFSIVRFQLLSKSSGLESPGLAPQTGRISRSGAPTGRISRSGAPTGRISRSGAPDREDLSIVRFQLLSKSSGLESPGLAP